MGGLRRINEIAPPAARAGTVSMFYVVTYAGSGLVTVGVGLLATLFGLTVSVRWFGSALAVACLCMLAALQSRHGE
jgi:purine-cytosine permease-like protein